MRAVASEWPLTAIITLVLSEARRWHYAKGLRAILSGIWRLPIVAVRVSNTAVAKLIIRSPMRLADKLVLVLWEVSLSTVSLPRGTDR